MQRKDKDPDPFSRPTDDRTIGTREPRRHLPEKVVPSSTTPMRRARCVATRTAGTLAVATATVTAVPFDAEIVDSVGLHDLVTNNTRITIPATGRVSGLWMFHGHVTWEAAAGGLRQLDLRRNGATIVATSITPSLGAGAQESMEILYYVDDPSTSDYYELLVTQTTGAPLNLATTPVQTYFEAIHLW